ncbi:heavy metal translocating P-type ATPase [Schaalia sp. ZJ1691]|uniref:heavy metal translocating P-type ATPase n=1 Tax=Schaalia sp. ZJ1691 TaxID=2709404 RepID=UPI0013ED7ED2|nr:heavy metal translocating P-type ATPase [Schaalia sp. ZJ1691]
MPTSSSHLQASANTPGHTPSSLDHSPASSSTHSSAENTVTAYGTSRPTEVGEGARRHAEELKRRLAIAAPLGIAVMVISMVPAFQFIGWQWVVAALSLPVVTWGAWPFHSAAFMAIRHGSTTMDTLVSLGVIASTLWSWWALIATDAGTLGMTMHMSLLPRADAHSGHAEIYFEGACMIVVFLLAGRWMEARARYRAGDALRSLLELGAKEATVLTADPLTNTQVERRVPVEDLRVGDRILVRPGEKVATDGVVESGNSSLDTSLLTGESIPVDVSGGDEVTGATMNTWGTLTIRVTRVGSDTTLAQIGRMVTDAQAGKAPVQRLADRISSVFVPVVIAVALATVIGWLFVGASVQTAVTSAVAVLVVACPCALGLATPTALLVGSGRASQLGIVIKSAEILEQTRRIDTIVLDKTGTVTTGKMALESVVTDADSCASSSMNEDDVLALVAGAEAPSEHPLARAIVAGAATRGVRPTAVTGFTNHAGLGVSALVPGASTSGSDLILVGRLSWLQGLGTRIPDSLERAVANAQSSGASAVVAAVVHGWEDSVSQPLVSVSLDEDEADRFAPQSPAPADLNSVFDPAPVATITMNVHGMTCASCVNRVERKLGKLQGVSASVNLATESAVITLTEPHTDEELEAIVAKAGYSGRVLQRVESSASAQDDDSDGHKAGSSSSPHIEGEQSSDATGIRVLPASLDEAHAVAVLVVRDSVKPSSAEAMKQLAALGIEPVLLTGDNSEAAHDVAQHVGIERVIAQVMPDEKRDVIAQLQGEGRVVAMVGDGVNDAAALAQASVKGLGIAMGSGTDVAIEVADITLVNSDLTSAAAAMRISRATLRIIKENLFWAFFYNVLMVPLAIAGMLTPMIASAAMACSSIFVVLNSLRLRRAH